jgi:hypothetical protein
MLMARQIFVSKSKVNHLSEFFPSLNKIGQSDLCIHLLDYGAKNLAPSTISMPRNQNGQSETLNGRYD